MGPSHFGGGGGRVASRGRGAGDARLRLPLGPRRLGGSGGEGRRLSGHAPPLCASSLGAPAGGGEWLGLPGAIWGQQLQPLKIFDGADSATRRGAIPRASDLLTPPWVGRWGRTGERLAMYIRGSFETERRAM